MDLKRLFNKGKRVIDQRGGVDSLKEDATEVKDIASGKGSLTDKAKDAAAAVKEPGAPGGEGEPADAGKPHGEGQHRQPEAGEGEGAQNRQQP